MSHNKHPAEALAVRKGGLRKTVRRLLAGAYPVPEAPNRRYPNTAFVELASLAMARRSSLADTAQANPRLPDSDTLHHHLHHCHAGQVLAAFQDALDAALETTRCLGHLDGAVDVAIDRHNEDFYGQEHPWVMGKKHGHGTNKAHAYLTSQRIQDPRITLDLQRLDPFRDQHAALEDVLANTLQRQEIKTFYLDKGFYNRQDLALLEQTGCDFVVPAPRDRFIHRHADRLWNTKRPVAQDCYVTTMEHEVGDPRHGPTPVVLVFHWEPDPAQPLGYSLFAYACPRVANDAQLHAWAKSYRSRWSIETSYRVTEQHRLRTTTTHYANRLFVTCIVFLLDTVWRILRYARQQRDPRSPLLTMPRLRSALLAETPTALPT